MGWALLHALKAVFLFPMYSVDVLILSGYHLIQFRTYEVQKNELLHVWYTYAVIYVCCIHDKQNFELPRVTRRFDWSAIFMRSIYPHTHTLQAFQRNMRNRRRIWSKTIIPRLMMESHALFQSLSLSSQSITIHKQWCLFSLAPTMLTQWMTTTSEIYKLHIFSFSLFLRRHRPECK